MFLRDVIYKFLDEHGFADTGASEKTDFTALQIRLKKVNDFNTCIEDFL